MIHTSNAYIIQSDSELKQLIAEAVREVIPEIVEQVVSAINNFKVSGGPKQKEIINLKETQELLGMYRDGVLKLLSNGELPFFKSADGRGYHIRRIDVLNLMQKHNANSESPFYKKLNKNK